jgi:DNA-binding LacI/PurR family transcriptional regulator
MLSALAAYRNSNRDHAFQGTLAWLTNYTAPDLYNNDEPYAKFWLNNAPYRLYFEGAKSQAKIHGYQLEPFELNTPGMTPARMVSILESRNIRGILVCPPPGLRGELDFRWERFSAVTFGYSLTKPTLHTIGTSQYRAMVQTMRHVRAQNYSKIAFVFSSIHDQRADHNYLAGYLAEQHLAGQPPIFSPFEIVEDHPEDFKAWLRKEKPQALVTGNYGLVDFLDRIKVRVPQDIGIASAVLPTGDSTVTGVHEDYFNIGEVAVDFLTSMILRGERGQPSLQQHLHVEGRWVNGKTLPLRRHNKSA